MKLILIASLKDKEYLKNFSNFEINYLHGLGIYQIQKFGFTVQNSIKILSLIKEELYSRV